MFQRLTLHGQKKKFMYKHVDISVAVATEDGLITPIVANSDQKS